MSKTVIFQTIQFSISMQFSFIWFIDRALSGATTPGQSGPGSGGYEGVLHIPQNSSITGTTLSDYLVSYPGHSMEGSCPSAEMHLAYSTAPANLAIVDKRIYLWRHYFAKMILEVYFHIDWLIDFNCMSIHLGLFYAKM